MNNMVTYPEPKQTLINICPKAGINPAPRISAGSDPSCHDYLETLSKRVIYLYLGYFYYTTLPNSLLGKQSVSTVFPNDAAYVTSLNLRSFGLQFAAPVSK